MKQREVSASQWRQMEGLQPDRHKRRPGPLEQLLVGPQAPDKGEN